MGTFYDEGRFRLPESLAGKDVVVRVNLPVMESAQSIYETSLAHSQRAYQRLVEAGVPMEDARGVIPLSATHRLSWTLNLAALKHIVGKRSCQILQLGLWKPIILGMVKELVEKVDPMFSRIVDPPCFSNGKWIGCKFVIDNERRVSGADKLTPCSLYLNREIPREACAEAVWRENQTPEVLAEYTAKATEYARFWQRSATTGEPWASKGGQGE